MPLSSPSNIPCKIILTMYYLGIGGTNKYQIPKKINKPISYSSVRDYVKSTFKDIVSNIALFSTHSLRAGGASAPANAGVADRLFQRWKSVSAKAPSTRIRIFLNPQLFLSGYENIRVHTLCDHSVFISNSPVHTYPDSLRIH